MFYKPLGSCKTVGIDGITAKENLESLLHSDDHAFIYHCYNHYCCPIGYEKEPLDQKKIFHSDATKTEYCDLILVADTSRKYESIHCFKWEDIEKDLNMKGAEYLNIRRPDLGVQLKKKSSNTNNNERNLHCIIQFKRIDTRMSISSSADLFSQYLNNEELSEELEENEIED